MINRIIFPVPDPPSYTANKFLGEILYVPRRLSSLSKAEESKTIEIESAFVPCLYLPYSNGSTKLIIFFHGNAEDIGISYEMLDHLRVALKVNILAVEYPSYGIYNEIEMGSTAASGPSEAKIFSDAKLVYQFALT